MSTKGYNEVMDTSRKTQSSIMSYIDINPIATIGTINSDGSPHGSIVYVCTDNTKPIIYFITKSETTKYKNIQSNARVSVAITHPSENSTLQARGVAEEVQDAKIIDMAMHKLTKQQVNESDWLPPIAKLHAGAYVLIKVTLEWARLAQYQGMEIGDERTFTLL